MILLTVGTEQFPFDRLVRAFDELFYTSLRGECGFAQIGSSNYVPKNVEYGRLLPFQDFQSRVQEASVVVSHAGAGSLLTIERFEKPCVTVPRLKRFGEHVDDHQLDLAHRFAGTGRARVVRNLYELGDHLLSELERSAEVKPAHKTDYQLVDLMESIVQNITDRDTVT